MRTHGRAGLAAIVALGLVLSATAAFAADGTVADGEIAPGDDLFAVTSSDTDGNVNDPRDFGLVCPDRTIGADGFNVALGLVQTVSVTGTSPVTGSYKEGTGVTFSVRHAAEGDLGYIPPGGDGAQIPKTQEAKNGIPIASVVGNSILTVPAGWNSPRTPGRTWPTTRETAAQGRIQLVVAADAAPNPLGDPDTTNDQYLGTALWNAAGTKHSNNSLTGTTTASNDLRVQAIRWTVRDGGDLICNRAPSITSATFAPTGGACDGSASTLTVAFADPDLAVTSADEQLSVAVDWGDGSTPDLVTGLTGTSTSLSHTYAAVGSHTAGVTVTDQHGAAAATSAATEVLDGDRAACDREASATASFVATHVACGATASLVVTPNDPDAAIASEDGLTIDVDWGAGIPDSADIHQTGIKGNSPLTFPAPYTTAGPHTATVSWTDTRLDAASFTGSTTATVNIDYQTSGILSPINPDGSSIFKAGSTVPVKIRFWDCGGAGSSALAPVITITRSNPNPPPALVNETVQSTSAADTGSTMRFSDGQWIFNLATKSLADPTAKYHLVITIPSTGQTVAVDFALRT